MTRMGVVLNDDPMQDALNFVRSQPRLSEDQQIAAGDATAVPVTSDPTSQPSTPGAVTTAPIRQLIALNGEKDALEARLKEINADRERVTQSILDRWSEDGTQSIKLDGKTVYLRRSVYAKVLDREHVAEALREAGLDFMLTPNTNTLSAWLREREENGEPIPPGLDGIVGTFERFALGVRNGRQ